MENYNITSVHQINQQVGISFDTVNYSCFKFGDKQAAKRMANELFGMFQQMLDDHKVLLSDNIIVASSPYLYTPAASSLIKDEFVKLINELLMINVLPPVRDVKIHRREVYAADYGNMDKEGREKLVEEERFEFGSTAIDDSHLIIIDDVRITGLHERMIVDSISDFSPSRADFLYYAAIGDYEIPPNIEGALNFSYIKKLSDLKTLTSGDYQLTMRALKMILGSEEVELKGFLESQQREFVEEVYHATIGNGCASLPEYKQSFQILKSFL